MRHLTAEQFVDLAEGTRDEASVPHLLTCEACRRELVDLRLALTGVSAVALDAVGGASDVPEPSPLFWDHFSARVRAAVANDANDANDGAPARRASWRWSWPRVVIGAAAGALAVALVAFSSFVAAPSVKAPAAPVPPVAQLAPLEPLGSPDDPSLSLVAEYGSTLEWDEMREQMAVSTHPGGLDETVADLNGSERRELQKLLKEELARPGAQTDRL
jgi:hypothetical protein